MPDTSGSVPARRRRVRSPLVSGRALERCGKRRQRVARSGISHTRVQQHRQARQLGQSEPRPHDVPEDNEFLAITEHDAANFRFSASYLGIARSDDVVLIQMTANNTRTLAQKKALFKRMAQLLAERAGLRPEDVFVNLVEVPKENWSLGLGLAQYA